MAAQKHRSFTLRVPTEVYLEMAALAQGEGVFLNQKANQLILLGLGKHISLDAALRRLIGTAITEGGADV